MEITPSRIGFVSTHFNGTDRVSLESSIWQDALTRMGHECFYFTGRSTQPEERTVIVPEADFRHPDVDQLNLELYDEGKRSSKTSGTIQALRFHIKQHLHQFLQTFDINLLIVENALALPVNIPLGLALTEVIAETDIACLARHHDFAWEYAKSDYSPARDYIVSSFPPKLPSIQHVVATAVQADVLAMRVGVFARVIPYMRDFRTSPESHPVPSEAFADEVGINQETQIALAASPLQPPSRLDTVLAFIARMDRKPALLLTSAINLREQSYLKFIMETAELFDINVHLVGDRLETASMKHEEYALQLALYYQHAAYALAFGQTQAATAEAVDAIHFSKALVTLKNNPALQDLKVKGFKILELDAVPHLEAVRALEHPLQAPEQLNQIAEHNFKLGQQHLSLDILDQKLGTSLREILTS
jgi:hypothetical protein